MIRLSELEGMRVVTENGEPLGRVWELQSAGSAKCEPQQQRRRIEQLVVGRLGLLERLGWRELRAVVVPWSKVLRQKPGVFVVEGRAEDYAAV